MRTIISLLLAVPLVSAADYIWPTSASSQVSGTFAERRETHYHAGIDIRTHQTTGFPVFAVADGFVYRLYCSPWGYGRGVYFQTDDGLRCLYGHLSVFNDTLGAIVSREQRRRDRYRVDVHLSGNDRVRFRKGDLLGYTGATGAGPPHFHFEIRDLNDRPLNALTNGFGRFVLDTRPPILDRLGVRPMNADATVNGRHEAVAFDLRLDKSPSLHLSGPCAFSLLAHDVADSTLDAWMGLYGWDLLVDGVLRASTRYERFSYPTNWRIHIDADRGWAAEGWFPPYALWCQPGNTDRTMTRSRPGDGVLDWGRDLARGKHSVVIRAVDAHGNVDSLALDVYANAAPEIRGCYFANGILSLGWRDPDSDSVRIVVEWVDRGLDSNWIVQDTVLVQEMQGVGETNIPLSPYTGVTLRVHVVDETGGSCEAMIAHGESDVVTEIMPTRTGLSFRAENAAARRSACLSFRGSGRILGIGIGRELVQRWDPVERRITASTTIEWPEEKTTVHATIALSDVVEHEEVMSLMWVDTNDSASVTSPDWHASLRIPRNAVLERIPVTVGAIPWREDTVVFASPVYHFGPIWSAFAEEATVTISKTNPDVRLSQCAVFRFEPTKNRWYYEGSSENAQDHNVSATTRILGTFALIEDKDPPVLRDLYPADGDTVSGDSLRLRAVVYDMWSGIISDRSIDVYLDGKHVIAEYESDEGYVFYDAPAPLASGRHTLRVRANDRLGNSTEASATFHVR